MTQDKLVTTYLKYHDCIIPAHVANKPYIEGYSEMGYFGSEIGRVCRTMFKDGILDREKITLPNKEGGKTTYTKYFKTIKGQQELI